MVAACHDAGQPRASLWRTRTPSGCARVRRAVAARECTKRHFVRSVTNDVPGTSAFPPNPRRDLLGARAGLKTASRPRGRRLKLLQEHPHDESDESVRDFGTTRYAAARTFATLATIPRTASSCLRRLSATTRSSSAWCARQRIPMPPLPTAASTRPAPINSLSAGSASMNFAARKFRQRASGCVALSGER